MPCVETTVTRELLQREGNVTLRWIINRIEVVIVLSVRRRIDRACEQMCHRRKKRLRKTNRSLGCLMGICSQDVSIFKLHSLRLHAVSPKEKKKEKFYGVESPVGIRIVYTGHLRLSGAS